MENADYFMQYGLIISTDSNYINSLFGIDAKIQEILISSYEKVIANNENTVKVLLNLIDQYPQIPQFKNQLSVLYKNLGQIEKAYELNHYILREHPDYLFGLVNLANEYNSKGEYNKVPTIMGELFEIKALYPNRTEFHIDEIFAFYSTAINYFIGINDIEAAENRFHILDNISEQFDEYKSDDLDKILLNIMSVKYNDGSKYHSSQRHEKTSSITDTVISLEQPVFANNIIHHLYSNSMRIDHDLIKQILEMPRETLIADLHKVIYDSIERFDHYFNQEDEFDINSVESVTHAVFLLAELKSEESFEVLLDILRQDEDYLNFWFNDAITDIIGECLYIIGGTRFIDFKNFMLEPNIYSYSKTIISNVVKHNVFDNPSQRPLIVEWYKNLIKDIIIHKDEDSIIDYDWVSLMICDLVDIKAIELLPQIESLYKHDLVEEYICGKYKSVVDDINNRDHDKVDKLEIFENIYERYNKVVSTWHSYDGDDEAFFRNFENSDYCHNIDNITMPIINPDKNLNRNNPCPCGSGKKYKKCCLDKKN